MAANAQRVQDIFLAAIEVSDPAERSALLDRECAADVELRRRVELLLRADQDPASILETPAVRLSEMPSDDTIGLEPAADSPSPPVRKPDSAGPQDDDLLTFLTPSTRPGHLGRLGHYEILEVIGKGGFGTVLRAFDEKLHRVVAIKVLSPAYAANGSARKRFIREAQTAAAVKNEHVVAIHGVDDEAQPPYLVMEIIDGISLQDKIDKKGPLSIKEILRIGLQTAEGLAAAHKQGLVHRDIKPANILLENGVERVKITDFGLARAVDDASVTQSGTVAGTPMYMSPEQAEGLPIDHCSDLFSLGTVLYAMCTGHPPFRASGTHAVLKRVIDASPRPIREINNEIPQWLCDVIARLHAKKPEERFQSAMEVAEVLGQGLAHVQQPALAAPRFPLVDSLSSLPSNRFQVGDQVLAPLVPEWLYVCKVLEVKEDSVLVTFEGAHTAWVQANELRPDDVAKNTRVFDFTGWWGGHRPGTVSERSGDRVHVLYDNGGSKWTKLNKIVVPTDKLAAHGAVVPVEPSDPKAAFQSALQSQLVASPYIFHTTRKIIKIMILGMVFGAGLGVALGLASPTLMPWAGIEANYDNIFMLGFWGGLTGLLLAMLVTIRFLGSHFRSRTEKMTGLEGPKPAITRGTFRSNLTWMLPVAAGIIVVATVLGMKWLKSSPSITVSANDPEMKVTFTSLDVTLDVTGPAFNMVSLPEGNYAVQIRCGPSRKLEMVSMAEWREPRLYPNLQIQEDRFELEIKRGEHPTLVIKTSPISPKVELTLEGTPSIAVAPFNAAKAKEHQDAWATHLGVPVEIENSIGMKLRLIPPGKFRMGTTDADPKAWNDKPQHEVTLTRPFFVGAHEVTVRQFQAFVDEKGYKTEAERGAGAYGASGPNSLMHDRNYSWKNPGFKQAADHPVVCVTLNDVKSFCEWLSKKEGRAYAVLTEAQWEYCCRAGSQTQYSFGDDPGLLDRHGWYQANSNVTTHPVGGKEANAWGLFDMHGNVSEWTSDWIGKYDKASQQDPRGPVDGTQHSTRGGSWGSLPEYCRSSWRELGNGNEARPSAAAAWTGFRVAIVGDLTTLKNASSRSEPRWVSLFNDKDLTGWKKFGDAMAGGGELVLAPGGAVDSAEKMPRSFHLRMQLKLDAGETTVRFHAPPRTEHPPANLREGWHVKLMELPGRAGKIYVQVREDTVEQPNEKILPGSTDLGFVADTGKWITLEIKAWPNNAAEVLVNGQQLTRQGRGTVPGVITLWNSGGPNSRVDFRDIEFKRLDSPP